MSVREIIGETVTSFKLYIVILKIQTVMCRTVCVPVTIIENTMLKYSVIQCLTSRIVCSMHAYLAYRDLNSCVEFTCRDSLTRVIAVESVCIALPATTIRITLPVAPLGNK